MKLKFYAALISAMMLLSFASNAATADRDAAKSEKMIKSRKQAQYSNKKTSSFSFKSSAYNKDGLVKKKRYKKGSCPSFD